MGKAFLKAKIPSKKEIEFKREQRLDIKKKKETISKQFIGHLKEEETIQKIWMMINFSHQIKSKIKEAMKIIQKALTLIYFSTFYSKKKGKHQEVSTHQNSETYCKLHSFNVSRIMKYQRSKSYSNMLKITV
jgi:hypothetical protein